jgi:DNA-binding transcriptional regulator GbsR (MarR family)
LRQFDKTDLEDTTSLNYILKDIQSDIKDVEDSIEKIDKEVNNYSDPKGLKMELYETKSILNRLKMDFDNIIDSNKQTSKTVKNTAISSALGGSITIIVGYVLKQLGIW